MDLRWGESQNSEYSIWNLKLEFWYYSGVNSFIDKNVCNGSISPIPAWLGKEGIPSPMDHPLLLCSLKHLSNITGWFSTCCLYVLLQLSGAASSFSNKAYHKLPWTYSKKLASLLWECICKDKQVFAMLEGLTLWKVFSLGPENRWNCCPPVPLVMTYGS